MKHLLMNRGLLFFAAIAILSPSLQAADICDCPGDAYYSCRRACMVSAAIGIGALVFAGMIIIIGDDGNSSHAH